jgi:hypothetical protein
LIVVFSIHLFIKCVNFNFKTYFLCQIQTTTCCCLLTTIHFYLTIIVFTSFKQVLIFLKISLDTYQTYKNIDFYSNIDCTFEQTRVFFKYFDQVRWATNTLSWRANILKRTFFFDYQRDSQKALTIFSDITSKQSFLGNEVTAFTFGRNGILIFRS